VKFKLQFREREYDLVRSIYSGILDRAVSKLRSLARGEEVRRVDLFPPHITVIEENGELGYNSYSVDYDVEILDERFASMGAEAGVVPLEAVSSSVAVSFTLNVILYALSQRHRHIVIAVEEPEETLAPPQ
jgi:hypothetical protein